MRTTKNMLGNASLRIRKNASAQAIVEELRHHERKLMREAECRIEGEKRANAEGRLTDGREFSEEAFELLAMKRFIGEIAGHVARVTKVEEVVS